MVPVSVLAFMLVMLRGAQNNQILIWMGLASFVAQTKVKRQKQ